MFNEHCSSNVMWVDLREFVTDVFQFQSIEVWQRFLQQKDIFAVFPHPIHFATVEEFSPDPSQVKCSGSVAVKVLEKATGTVIIVIPNPSRIVMPRRGRRLVLDPLLRSCHASVPWTSLHKHHHSYHYHQPIVAPRATYRLFSFVWK